MNKADLDTLMVETMIDEAKKNPQTLMFMELGFTVGLSTGVLHSRLLIHRGVLKALRQAKTDPENSSMLSLIDHIFNSLKDSPELLTAMELKDVTLIWKSIENQMNLIIEEASKLAAKS